MMNDEKNDKDFVIKIELLKFWKTLSVVLAIILLTLITWYNITQTYNFVKSPCDALEEQILDRKDLWTRHCGLIINGTAIPGMNPENLKKLTNTSNEGDFE